jgi:hypothetical protein
LQEAARIAVWIAPGAASAVRELIRDGEDPLLGFIRNFAGFDLTSSQAVLADLLLHHQADGLEEGLEHSFPLRGDRGERRRAARIEELIQLLIRHEVVEVAFVVLHDQRELVEVDAVGLQVAAQVLDRTQVLFDPAPLRVDHEHDGVRALQHIAPHLHVLVLPGHREALNADLEALDLAEIDRQEVEEKRRVLLGVDRDELDLIAWTQQSMHDLEAGRLAAEAYAVVDELGGNRLFCEVDETHECS